MSPVLNVRFSCTRVTHAKAHNELKITRCGIRYVRNGSYVIGDMDQWPMGHVVEGDIDCMSCLVKDEWHNAGVREIILADSVKDMQEQQDDFSLRETMVALGVEGHEK